MPSFCLLASSASAAAFLLSFLPPCFGCVGIVCEILMRNMYVLDNQFLNTSLSLSLSHAYTHTHTHDAVISLTLSHTTHTHPRCGMGVIQSGDMFFSFSRQRSDQGYKSWQSCPTQKLIKGRKIQPLRSNKPLPAILIVY